jgi:hypothetical protein
LAARPKRNRWLTGIGAVIVVVLLVSLSALIFAQLKQHQAGTTSPKSPPPIAHWKQVLKGYTLISLTSTRNDPAIVYACAIREIPNASRQSTASPISILRSVDFGDHWQDIGGSVVAGDTCQLAVNSENSDDIYAVSNGNTMPTPEELKHSQNGGKTWETILPVMHDSSQTPVQ